MDGPSFHRCDGARGDIGADADDGSVHGRDVTSITISTEDAPIYC